MSQWVEAWRIRLWTRGVSGAELRASSSAPERVFRRLEFPLPPMGSQEVGDVAPIPPEKGRVESFEQGRFGILELEDKGLPCFEVPLVAPGKSPRGHEGRAGEIGNEIVVLERGIQRESRARRGPGPGAGHDFRIASCVAPKVECRVGDRQAGPIENMKETHR